MNHVIAVLTGDDDNAVRGTAGALAHLLGVGVRSLRPLKGDRVDRIDALATALGRPDVEAGALRIDAPEDLCWDLLPRIEAPLLILPVHPGSTAGPLTRVLVPLDGCEETAAGLGGIADRLVSGGAELVAVHVFVPDTVPAFWDQAAHSHEPWRAEFLRRNLPTARDLGLRRGEPAAEVREEVAASGVDMLLMGWSQNLSEGHAGIVREALTRGSVPVLLVRTTMRPAG